jgi:hypothetical protein
MTKLEVQCHCDEKVYLEEKKEEFFEGDSIVQEAIIEELKNEGHIDLAEELEYHLHLESFNFFSNDDLNRIDEMRGK